MLIFIKKNLAVKLPQFAVELSKELLEIRQLEMK